MTFAVEASGRLVTILSRVCLPANERHLKMILNITLSPVLGWVDIDNRLQGRIDRLGTFTC